MTVMVVASIVVPDGADGGDALTPPAIAPTAKTRPKRAATPAASQSGCTRNGRPGGREFAVARLAFCDAVVAAPVFIGMLVPFVPRLEDVVDDMESDESLLLSCICRLLIQGQMAYAAETGTAQQIVQVT